MARRKGILSRLKDAAAAVRRGVERVFAAPPEPKRAPPPKKGRGPSFTATLDEIARLIEAEQYELAEAELVKYLKRNPTSKRAKKMLERVRYLMQLQLDLFERIDEKPDENLRDLDKKERAAEVERIRKANATQALEEMGVPDEVVEEIRAVEDWNSQYFLEVEHNGQISADNPTAPRTDTFVGDINRLTQQMVFWAQHGEIYRVEFEPLAWEVDSWRPLWEHEEITTIRGTRQGRGKRKPKQRRGRPQARHGSYTKEEWRKQQSVERNRRWRAKKTEEKIAEILRTEGPVAAKRYRKMIEKKRRAGRKSAKGKKK